MVSAVADGRTRQMRRARLRRVAIPLVAGAAALAVVTPASATPAVATPVAAKPASATRPAVGTSAGAARAATARPTLRTVAYAGVRLSVPATWPVVDLDRNPTACVRFDTHAVYLGAAGPDQACPARVIGRTETVWVAPATRSGVRTLAAVPGVLPPASVDTAAQQLAVAPAGTGVTVTATWGTDRALVQRIVASGTRGPVLRPSRPAFRAGGVVTRFPVGATSTAASGYAFDACAAPSSWVMAAWKRFSPYNSIGAYIGGINRGCAQPNLNQPWISQVMGTQGWRVLPLYVGRQAPCSGRSDLAAIDPGRAFAQGAAEARDAVGRARTTGMHPGSVLYNDMEGYPRGGACTAAVLSYLTGWTNQLHATGWLSGVYSSASGAIADLAVAPARAGYTSPDIIWTARWDGSAHLFGETYVPDTRWASQQRVKQYLGDHTERWGGYSINVDSNRVEAAGATIAYLGRVRASAWAHWSPSTSVPGKGLFRVGAPVYYTCILGGQVVSGSPRWVRLFDGRLLPSVALPPAAGVPFCALPGQVLSELNMRSGPSSAGPVRGVLHVGALARVACQASGQRMGNTRVWDRLSNGLWVSDGWVATPGRPAFSPTYPRC